MTWRQKTLYQKVKNASGWVHLSQQDIGDAEAQAIAQALTENTTVTRLSMYKNQVSDAGALSVAQALELNKTVKELYLSENQIGDAGAQAIAEALKVNTTVTALVLHRNQIGDAGAHAIAAALKENKTVSVLVLYHNQISDAGARAIAEALKENKTLTILFLANNFLTRTGITAFKQPGSTICQFKSLGDQLAHSVQIAASAPTNAQSQPSFDLDFEIQQLRSDLAVRDSWIDVLQRSQPAFGSFAGSIPKVPLAELVTATNNFADDLLIGQGGFGRVYRASLSGQRVAVKRLSAESVESYATFQLELDSLSRFRHPNIITILFYTESHDGYCLVYELMPNGSVRDRLDCKNNTPPLTWTQRHRIAADVSRGMKYVQTAFFPEHVLLHRDLKTDNVLLDAHFNAKVSDFGLVRDAPHFDEQNYLCTQNIQGTRVYMCPEFVAEGRMTTKTDVYAFGVILLELVSAEKPCPRLISAARKAVQYQTVIELLDSALDRNAVEHQSVSELAVLALECLDDAADGRPSFCDILDRLRL
ncbi:TKL/IRAK protein kinase [Capsaspora owczarzaki ATCC 30864]|uniref:TKL/IRAK protein kinase n=1 Tax=Capsaspora owczarzaki (strain ATCC 30864) TaxID=595528 RepID=A0A0D2U6G3_CAPO3|nr:TKL/IRAK protein kinase [Capsaspora owczarzaki ATCC 30864]